MKNVSHHTSVSFAHLGDPYVQLGWLIELVKNATWADFLYSLYLLLFSIAKILGIHINKFFLLHNQQKRVLSVPALDAKKFILNLSRHALKDAEEAVLMKGLNF
jgi:hypothetical protein